MVRGTLLATVAILIVSSCSSAPKTGAEVTSTAVGSGWECLLAANSLEAPGLIFRVNADGTRFDGAKLDIPYQEGIVGYIELTDEGSIKAGALVRLLGIPGTSLSGAADASSKNQFSVKVSLSDRIERRTYDVDLLQSLKSFDPSFLFDDADYYVIREVTLTKKHRVSVDKSALRKLGAEADFAAEIQAKASASISQSNEQTFEIDQTFDEHVPVCIKAEKFNPGANTTGAGGTVFSPELTGEFYASPD